MANPRALILYTKEVIHMAKKLYTKERFGSRELAYLPYTYIITHFYPKVKTYEKIKETSDKIAGAD